MNEEFYVVVTQFDSSPDVILTGIPKGPLVHEGYLLTREQAQARAEQLKGRYGWVAILAVQS